MYKFVLDNCSDPFEEVFEEELVLLGTALRAALALPVWLLELEAFDGDVAVGTR